MKKQFLKMAGVKSEKEFYNLYKSPEDFFAKFPEAREMVEMKYGGVPQYQGGGASGLPMNNPNFPMNFYNPYIPQTPQFITPPTLYPFNFKNSRNSINNTLSKFIPQEAAQEVLQGLKQFKQMQMGGQEMSNEQAAQMQEQQQAAQMQQQGAPQQQLTEEQIVQFIAQSLASQELSPEEILQVLVERVGLEEQQAVQLIEAVAAKLNEQGGGQGMAQQPQQQMMKYGGYSGTYDAGSGSYFKMGGNANAGFQVGSVHNLPQSKIDELVKKGYKVKYI
jgi:hypothetical protein